MRLANVAEAPGALGSPSVLQAGDAGHGRGPVRAPCHRCALLLLLLALLLLGGLGGPMLLLLLALLLLLDRRDGRGRRRGWLRALGQAQLDRTDVGAVGMDVINRHDVGGVCDQWVVDRAGEAALVAVHSRVTLVDHRAAGGGLQGRRRTAVVGEAAKLGVLADDVTVAIDADAVGMLDQVVIAEREERVEITL